jgi:hypothetical protein
VLTADARFEGWTTEDWIRFTRLWKPRVAPDRDAARPRGGIIVVHDDGQVLKLLHTRNGRLDPHARPSLPPPPPSTRPPAPRTSDAGAASGAPSGEPALPVAEIPRLAFPSLEARATALRSGQPWALGEMARVHHASWALSMQLGALDEIMERFGARARRGDDFTAQALMFVGIVREMIAEKAIVSWPQKLPSIPMPTPAVIRRTLDTLCADGQAIALALFDDGALWTSFVARRRGPAFDVIAGPDEIRPALGLLSGDWRRDYRHFAHAVEERYGPLGFGCFAELGTFRALQTDPRPGVWSRAVAVRDIVVSPIPVAVGVALGLDGVHYAIQGIRAFTGRIAPLAPIAPLLGSARSSLAKATGRDVPSLLGFDPLEVLRKLLAR